MAETRFSNPGKNMAKIPMYLSANRRPFTMNPGRLKTPYSDLLD